MIPRTASLFEHFTTPLRVLLAVACISGLIGWAYVTLFAFAWGGQAMLHSPVVLVLLFGDFYLLLSLYRAFKSSSFRSFTITGALLNPPIVVYAVYLFSHIENRLALPAMAPLGFLTIWLLLWLARWFASSQTSRPAQVVTVSAVVISLFVGALWIKSWSTDPTEEAQRLSIAAAEAGDREQAKRLFSKAKSQAKRIQNPFSRDQPLQIIAYYQAKVGLIDDALNTSNECSGDFSKTSAFNSVVRGEVDYGDWRGAIDTAKAHDSGGSLFMALKDRGLALIDSGDFAQARDLVRLIEATADDPYFENSRRWNFGYVALLQAKLGMHQEALASARKTGVEHAPEHIGFVAIAEKQSGHLEHSRASLIEAIDAVKALREEGVSRDSTLSELADRFAESGLYDEARLIAESIQSDSTKEILFRSMEYKRASGTTR